MFLKFLLFFWIKNLKITEETCQRCRNAIKLSNFIDIISFKNWLNNLLKTEQKHCKLPIFKDWLKSFWKIVRQIVDLELLLANIKNLFVAKNSHWLVLSEQTTIWSMCEYMKIAFDLIKRILIRDLHKFCKN